MEKNRILSGIQPTGNLHLGNYLGAIKNFVSLQNNFDCLYMLADYHAITTNYNQTEIKNHIFETTAAFLASGLDNEKNIIFRQSRVPAHLELAWILNCVARLGWLNRMTQFKEKAGENKEKASVGLYTYPVLMAADILIYGATHVPVGEDQKQHLELCRDIAQKFNNDFKVKDFFKLPEPIIPKNVSRIMSLRDGTKKMSKSDPSDSSRINLKDSNDQISQKIRKAKTDNEPIKLNILDENSKRFEAKNLISIYASLQNKDVKEIIKEYDGKTFSIFKNKLIDVMIDKIGPISNKIKEIQKDKTFIEKILDTSEKKANKIANDNLVKIKNTIGLI